MRKMRPLYSSTSLGLIMGSLFIVDRLSKWIAVKRLFLTQWYVLSINNKAPFSLPVSNKIMLCIAVILVAALIVITLHYWYFNRRSCALWVMVVIVGAVSNIWDRMYYGGVIDFLTINNVSAFNIADFYIGVGFVGYFISTHWYNIDKKIILG